MSPVSATVAANLGPDEMPTCARNTVSPKLRSTRFADRGSVQTIPDVRRTVPSPRATSRTPASPSVSRPTPGNRKRDHPGEQAHRRADADRDVAEVGGALDGIAVEAAHGREVGATAQHADAVAELEHQVVVRAADRCRPGARGCSCTRSRPESSGCRAACRPRCASTRRRGRSRERSCPRRARQRSLRRSTCAPSRFWPDRSRRSAAHRPRRGPWTLWVRGSAARCGWRPPGRRSGSLRLELREGSGRPAPHCARGLPSAGFAGLRGPQSSA